MLWQLKDKSVLTIFCRGWMAGFRSGPRPHKACQVMYTHYIVYQVLQQKPIDMYFAGYPWLIKPIYKSYIHIPV